MKQLVNNNTQKRYDRIGFNIKKRTKRLIRLAPVGAGSNIDAINRIEQDLLRDINDIDRMLQKRQTNMAYIQGFLFSLGPSKQLLQEFHSALLMTPDAVEDGFYLWRLRERNNNYELVSSKLVNSPRHFPQKLMDKSIENLMHYEKVKYAQSIGKTKERWDISVRAAQPLSEERGRRVKTEFEQSNRQAISSRKYSEATGISEGKNQLWRRLSDFKQVAQAYGSHSHPIQMQSFIHPKKSKIVVEQTTGRDEAASVEELSIMLKKQAQIVSIWLPPSACPQLMGVMSLQIKEKSLNVTSCLIKKYFWYRHGLSKRLFDSLLRWASLQFGLVGELVLVTSREVFNSIFSSIGWHLAGWINEDKVRISFTGF